MKNKLPYIIATAILVGVAMLPVYSQSVPTRVSPSNHRTRPPNPPNPPTLTESLSLTLTVRKPTVLLLEPIALQFTVANKTNGSWNFRGGIALSSPRLKLTIRKPGGETFTPKQLSYSSGGGQSVVGKDYKAGEVAVWKETLEFRLGDYFGEIGEYQLQASFLDGNDSWLTTDWVTLFVEYPQGHDALAYEKLKTIPGMRDGTFVMGVDPKSTRQAYIEEFPDSRYSDYFRYKTAEGLSNTDREKAIEYFEALSAKPDFVFASDAKEHLDQLRAEKEEAKRLEEHRAAKKLKGDTPIQMSPRRPVRVN